MRYSLASRSLSVEQLRAEATKVGAQNIKETPLTRQVFCELDENQFRTLSAVPEIMVKSLKTFRLDTVMIPEIAQEEPQQAVGTDPVWTVFENIRGLFSPPLTGSGLTVAVLDTGIRKSHESLEGKVIYEANFSTSPDAEDVFQHGTQVAFVIAGGVHGSQIAGVSPGASLFNIKVMDDEGVATDEEVVSGIEAVCALVQQAFSDGLQPTDPMWPNVINLSLGAHDDGDSDNPIRAACRVASSEYLLDVVAAAGNYGPKMTTVTIPATEPEVIAVGAIEKSYDIQIWEKSSRGPTKEGTIKPDFVLWGVDIEAASSGDDSSYVAKSGTSFSAPILSGMTGLLWETGRRVYGEDWRFRWTEAREFAPYYCMKPEEAPILKDRDYGYGLPAVGTMVGRLASARAAFDVSTMMTPMMLMMMIMSMMKVMV